MGDVKPFTEPERRHANTGRHPIPTHQMTYFNSLGSSPTARIEENRQIAATGLGQESCEPLRSFLVETPLSCDPFAATLAAGICCASGDEKRDRLFVVGLAARALRICSAAPEG